MYNPRVTWTGRIAVGALLSLLLASPAPASGEPDWNDLFRGIRDSVGKGRWHSAKTNEEGYLAWSESYVLMAFVSHYLGTGDVSSLDRLVEHGDRVLANRDDRLGLEDAFRGKAVAGWGSTKYTKGKRFVWAVHSGMIVHPLAELCRLVDGRKELGERFGKTAARWKPLLLEAIRVFDPEWREGPGEGEGHYVGLSLGGKPLPLNMVNALGRALLSVSRWKDAPAWAGDRARKLLRHLRNRLTPVREKNAWDWAYWPVKGRGEDISHAAINVDFAAMGARFGEVFGKAGMKRFANTLLRVVRRKDGFADTVSGTGRTGRHALAVGRWLALATWDPRVREVVGDFFGERIEDGRLPASVNDLLAAANLCRYGRD